MFVLIGDVIAREWVVVMVIEIIASHCVLQRGGGGEILSNHVKNAHILHYVNPYSVITTNERELYASSLVIVEWF